MIINTFKRYERKYSLTQNKLDKLLGEVKAYMNPDEYCTDGRIYTIYNIYFDDDKNDVIRHSLSKPYYKEKLRLRSYTPFSNPEQKVYFELKKKIGGIVSKRRATMTLKQAMDFYEKGIVPRCSKYADNQVVSEIAFYLKTHNVLPKVFISYDRIAFFGKDDQDFRLTFDNNINTRRDDLFEKSSEGNLLLLPTNKYIMEIKISSSIPLWLTKAMAELNIKRVSFSKYGNEYKAQLQKPTMNIKYTVMPSEYSFVQGLCMEN